MSNKAGTTFNIEFIVTKDNVEAAFKAVKKTAEDLNITLAGGFTKYNEATKETTTKLNLIAKELTKIEVVQEAVNKALKSEISLILAGEKGLQSSVIVRENVVKQKLSAEKALSTAIAKEFKELVAEEKTAAAGRLNTANKSLSDRVALVKEKLAQELALYKHNGDSIEAVKLREAAALRALEQKKQERILPKTEAYKAGTLSKAQYDFQTNAVLNSYKILESAIKKQAADEIKVFTDKENLKSQILKAHTDALKEDIARKKAIAAQEKALYDTRLAEVNKSLSDKVNLTRERLAQELALYKANGNSIELIRLREAAALRSLEQRKQERIAPKQEAFVAGNLSKAQYDFQVNAVLNSYRILELAAKKQAITEVKVFTDKENLKTQILKAHIEAIKEAEARRLGAYKTEVSKEQALFRSAMAMRNLIQAEGLASLAVKEEGKRNAETRAEQVYKDKLLQIEKDYIAKLISLEQAKNARVLGAERYTRALQNINTNYTPQIALANSLAAADSKLNSVLAEQIRLQDSLNAKKRNGFLGNLLSTPTANILRPSEALKVSNPTKYISEMKAYTDQVLRANSALDASMHGHRSWALRVIESIGIYRIFTSVINQTQQALLNIPKAGIRLEETTAALSSAGSMGNLTAAHKQMAFLREEADRTGISIVALQKSYITFSTSAILAGESLDKTNQIFRNVNTMATTLHKSSDDVSGIFLAFSQIYGKGKLQAEELVKQLAQRVPGAVEIAAMAYRKLDKTTGQYSETMQQASARLLKDMKAGRVSALEIVSSFAGQFDKLFGGDAFTAASKGLNATLGRMSTSYELFSENIYKISQKTLTDIITSSTGGMNELVKLTDDTTKAQLKLREFGTGFLATVGAIGAGFALMRINSFITSITWMGTAILPALGNALTNVGTRATGMWAALNSATAFQKGSMILGAMTTGVLLLASAYDTVHQRQKVVDDYLAEIEAKRNSKKSPEAAKAYAITQDEGVKIAKGFADQAEAEFRAQEDTARKLVSNNPSVLLARVTGNSVEAAITEAVKTNFPKIAVLETKAKETAYALIEATKFAEKQLKEAEEKTKGTGINLLDTTLKEDTASTKKKLLDDEVTAVENASKLKVLAIKQEQAAYENLLASKDIKMLPEAAQLSIIEKKKAFANRQLQEEIQLIKEKAALEEKYRLTELNSLETGIKAQDNYIGKITAAIMQQESTGNPNAVSPKGAMGLMQIMSGTAKDPGFGMKPLPAGASPEQNKAFGDEYFTNLLKKYKGSVPNALAAYNWGMGNMDAFLSPGGGASKGGSLPPETRDYVSKIIGQLSGKGAGVVDLLFSDKARMDEKIGLGEKSLELVSQENSALEQRSTILREQSKLLEDQKTLREEQVQKLQTEIEGLSGGKSQSAIAKVELDYQKELKSLQADVEKKRPENTAAIALLKTKKSLLLLDAELVDAEVNKNLAAEKLQTTEQRINIEKELGYKTELDALKELIAARVEYSKEAERYIGILDVIATKQQSPEKKLKVQQELNTLDQFKYQGAGAANNYLRAYQAPGKSEYEAQQVKFDDSLPKDLELAGRGLDPVLQAKEIADKRLQVQADYEKASTLLAMEYSGQQLALGSSTAEGLTASMVQMYSAQSTAAKSAFAVYKAMKVAELLMAAPGTIMKAYDAGVAIPYVGIVAGPAFAATAAAFTAAQIAQVVASPMPQAHAGLTNVPEDQTYLLSRGERVLAPQQNKDLTKALAERGSSITNNNSLSTGSKIKVINVGYGEDYKRFLTSADGEEVIVNHMRQNKEAIA